MHETDAVKSAKSCWLDNQCCIGIVPARAVEYATRIACQGGERESRKCCGCRAYGVDIVYGL